MKRSFVYIVFGATYQTFCNVSVASLRKWHPDDQIIIISNDSNYIKRCCDAGCEALFVDPHIDFTHTRLEYKVSINKAKSRWCKTQLLRLISNFQIEQFMFLDADTEIHGSLNEAFDILDTCDISMAQDKYATLRSCAHCSEREREFTGLTCPPQTVQLNSGVFICRINASIRALFNCWYMEWLEFKNIDQLALMRAFQKVNGIKIKLLPERFNFWGFLFGNGARVPIPPGTCVVHYLGKK